MTNPTYTLPMRCKRCKRHTYHIYTRRWWLFTLYRCQLCGTGRNHRFSL